MKKLILPALLFLALAAFGQLDPGDGKGHTFDLYESGNKVGEVFVPYRPAGATHYVEHWVMFPNYVYPSPKSLATLDIVPQATSAYRDENDFFKRVPFARGAKYARVDSEEFDYLPAVQRK